MFYVERFGLLMKKQNTQIAKEPTVSYGFDTVQQLKKQIAEAIGSTDNIGVSVR